MNQLVWINALNIVKPYVFRIDTPDGYGTGFQIFNSEDKKHIGIATALHVVEHAFDWNELLKIRHFESRKEVLIDHTQRETFKSKNFDLALILLAKNKLPVKDDILELVPDTKRLLEGSEIGWCGFPVMAPNNLCFFAGHVSSYLPKELSYLVDGVAISGVSGGPAFSFVIKEDTPPELIICGLVSAYIPTRVSGESLPGVCWLRTVAAFHKLFPQLKRKPKNKDEKNKNLGANVQHTDLTKNTKKP